MAVTTLKVTIGAGLTQITTSSIFAKWVQFQNNAAHVMRVGDANTSSTQGISLSVGGGFFAPPLSAAGAMTELSQWYVSGTAADVLDVIYDSVNF